MACLCGVVVVNVRVAPRATMVGGGGSGSRSSHRRIPLLCSSSVSPLSAATTEVIGSEASTTGGAYDFLRATTSLTEKLLASPKKVTLVRHGLSSWNEESRVQGSSNLSVLTETGIQQAERCRNALSNIDFDKCFSSPISRAKSTAEVIWQGREEPLVFLDSLKEAHLYFLEGMKNVDARKIYPKEYETWREDPANFCVNGVYPIRKLWETSREAWKEILLAPGEDFLVVTHKSMLRALICVALGLGPERFRAIDINNGGICVFNFNERGEAMLQSLNLTTHMSTDHVYTYNSRHSRHHHQPPPPPPLAFSAAHVALQRASANPTLPVLKQIHAHLIATGANGSLSLVTKLLRLLAATVSSSSSSLPYTLRIFQSLPEPDAFLLNTLITRFAKSGLSSLSLYFYRRMLLSNVPPSSYTFTSVIKACGDLNDSKLGMVVHGQVLTNGYVLDPYVQASLVGFYGKIGEVKFSRKLFDRMPERSVVAWNSMICGYEQNGRAKEAIDVFLMMREARDVNPDSTTFVGVLSACAELGALELGCWVHEYLERNGFDLNVVLGTAMINMYARCGNVTKAREVFENMDERNVIASTAMINAYGMNGYGKVGIEIFNQMFLAGLRPNSITFVAVLSACAHAGLVEVGRRVFSSMKEEYDIEPGVEHYVCMVDMLGRAGLLDEAFEFIEEKIPSDTPVAVWSAMLGACKMHKNFNLGLKVADRLLTAEPDNPCHYVMLSNIYATAGRVDGVQMVRNKMIRRGLKKQVGHSTTEVDGKTYMFSMGDRSHPETNAIYKYLDEVMLRCTEAGYVPVAEALMHELEGEEREHALKFHSEKLAIAFGMMKTRDGSIIRIVKNLRMCEDCHSVIKYMSTVTKREIIVRDKLRFHHFKEGSCSCLDYW